MKRFFLCLLCVAATATGYSQQKVKLDSRASVVFPGKTNEMQGEAGPITYSPLDKDNKVMGMATAIDVSQFGVDSTAIAANYNNSMFIDLILQNIVGQFAGAELVSKKKVANGKLMGYDVVFKNHNPTADVPYENIYAHIMFLGSHVYALSVLDANGANGAAFTEDFFNSLKVD